MRSAPSIEEMTTTEAATGQSVHIMNPCAMVSLPDTARTNRYSPALTVN